MAVNLKEKPFFLNDDDISWVKNAITKMSYEEKIGQLFCLISFDNSEKNLSDLIKKKKPGGFMFRTLPISEMLKVNEIIRNSEIPLFISANIEKGGNGIVDEGTNFGSPLSVAATGDKNMAYKLGKVGGAEGAAVGVNWTYSPLVDLDLNFRNPITNTRTFGSDPKTVLEFGIEFIKGIQENNVAACIKHFPGDGVDERDQHLLTSINSMSIEEWENNFGKIYRGCIEAGVLSCMIGHIALPSYTKKLRPDIKDKDILPATLSQELITGLLREKLGFNGLIITDSTLMAGYNIPMSREKAVPISIAAGCDMFLFTRDIDEDYEFMKKGVEDGIITLKRLDDALTRILGMKAALKLHKNKENKSYEKKLTESKNIIGKKIYNDWAKDCADRSITLVKEEENILPISPEKYKKILIYCLENQDGFFSSNSISAKFVDILREEGYTIDCFDPKQGIKNFHKPYKSIVNEYDAMIYLANLSTKSNQTMVRIEWAMPLGADVPIYINSIPTIFISVENPYHLLDVPRVKTYINSYAASDIVIQAIIDKLSGRSEFKGKSPIDPFCGKWDTKL